MNILTHTRLRIARINTPKILYRFHRFFFCRTNGIWNSFLTFFIRIFNPPQKFPSQGIIQLSHERLLNITQSIDQHGYYVFDEKLDSNTIDSIVSFAKQTPLRYIATQGNQSAYTNQKIPFTSADTVDSPRFQMDADDIFKSVHLRKLIFDKSLLTIAQSYFRSKPVFDLVALWWSKPEKKTDHKDYAAQKFHFDMDRIKFLKFFFYLTDVDSTHGPHAYVEGSHRFLPRTFRFDRRFDDKSVETEFGKHKIREFCEPKGSIFAVDTRGLHKGVPLTEGNRLIFQIEFANSMFGQTYEKIKLEESYSDVHESLKEYPLIYGPIFKN